MHRPFRAIAVLQVLALIVIAIGIVVTFILGILEKPVQETLTAFEYRIIPPSWYYWAASFVLGILALYFSYRAFAHVQDATSEEILRDFGIAVGKRFLFFFLAVIAAFLIFGALSFVSGWAYMMWLTVQGGGDETVDIGVGVSDRYFITPGASYQNYLLAFAFRHPLLFVLVALVPAGHLHDLLLRRSTP